MIDQTTVRQASRSERLEMLKRQRARASYRLDLLLTKNARVWTSQWAILLIGFFLAVGVFSASGVLSLLIILLAIVGFVIAIRTQRRLAAAIVRYRVLVQLKENQLARFTLDWAHIPGAPVAEDAETAPFEADLDISGEQSLHQLMNTAASLEGSQLLREWLLTTSPDLEEIQHRQALVQELKPLTLFRNKFMLHSLASTRYTTQQLQGEKLLLWLEALEHYHPRLSTLLVATAFSLFSFTNLILLIVGHGDLVMMVGSLLLAGGWFSIKKSERGNVSRSAAFIQSSFGQLSEIFTFLERYPYRPHSALQQICEPFVAQPQDRPSQLLKRLTGALRFTLPAIAEEPTLWLVLNSLLPLEPYAAYQLERRREQLLRLLPEWLEIWYELEALTSLANFAYLNADYTMPTIMPDAGQHFSASKLGHPLIPAEQKIVNDFSLTRPNEILLITGSNMAGKSTFLRTLGINLCLAYAGGPVNAESLECSLFELYACIKVSDSLVDGYSYFYAEVRRLKGLLDRLKTKPALPIFFLIDEIYRGTNNHERFVGSAAYIYALAGQNCVGAISTHDLELVKLAEKLPEIINCHFREEVIEGRMVFDYLLHTGPCPTTNALKIMQLEGLPTQPGTLIQ